MPLLPNAVAHVSRWRRTTPAARHVAVRIAVAAVIVYAVAAVVALCVGEVEFTVTPKEYAPVVLADADQWGLTFSGVTVYLTRDRYPHQGATGSVLGETRWRLPDSERWTVLEWRGSSYGSWEIRWHVLVGVVAVPWLVSRWRARRRQARRSKLGLCLTCGYNLTGNTSGRCPECGSPSHAPAAESGAQKKRAWPRRASAWAVALLILGGVASYAYELRVAMTHRRWTSGPTFVVTELSAHTLLGMCGLSLDRDESDLAWGTSDMLSRESWGWGIPGVVASAWESRESGSYELAGAVSIWIIVALAALPWHRRIGRAAGFRFRR